MVDIDPKASSAVAQALGIAKLQGYQPNIEDVELLKSVARGDVSADEAEAMIVAKFTQSGK